MSTPLQPLRRVEDRPRVLAGIGKALRDCPGELPATRTRKLEGQVLPAVLVDLVHLKGELLIAELDPDGWFGHESVADRVVVGAHGPERRGCPA